MKPMERLADAKQLTLSTFELRGRTDAIRMWLPASAEVVGLTINGAGRFALLAIHRYGDEAPVDQVFRLVRPGQRFAVERGPDDPRWRFVCFAEGYVLLQAIGGSIGPTSPDQRAQEPDPYDP